MIILFSAKLAFGGITLKQTQENESSNINKGLQFKVEPLPKNPPGYNKQIKEFHQQAKALIENFQYQDAITLLEQAIQLEKESGGQRHLGFSYTLLGDVYSKQGQYHKAIKLLNRALVFYNEADDRLSQARIAIRLASSYSLLSQYDKSVEYSELALKIAREQGNTDEEQISLRHLGFMKRRLARYAEAIDYFAQSLKIARETGNKLAEGRSLIGLGGNYYQLGEYEKAIEFFLKARTIATTLANLALEKESDNNLGLTYYKLKDYQTAITYLDNSLELSKEAKDLWGEITSLNNLALNYGELENYHKALDYHMQSLDLTKKIGNRFGEGGGLGNIGRTYAKLGDYEKAIEYYQQGLVLMREIKDRESQAIFLSQLMSYWKKLSEPKLATFFGKQSVNIFQDLRSNISGLSKQSQTAYLESKQHIYRGLADLLIDQGRLPEAQQVLDMLKEEEYFEFVRRDTGIADSLDKRVVLSPTENTWSTRYQEISGQLAAIGKQYGGLYSKSNNMGLSESEETQLFALEDDLAVARQAFDHFLDELRAEFEDSRQAEEKVFQIEETRGLMSDLKELGDGVVAIYTLVNQDKYRAILITPEVQIAGEYAISAANLNKKVAEFRQMLQSPGLDPQPLAEELYDILLGGLTKQLQDTGAQTLMWSLDGVLRYIPMAALHDGEQFLVEKYKNVVFTPASRARLKDEPSANWQGLGLGVSEAVGDFSALPGVREELEVIIRAEDNEVGVLPGAIKLDETFTKTDMRRELRKQYPLVHIASHFKFQPGDETESFLLLGDGSHLSLAEIKNLPNVFQGVDLLTLSACDTATGGTGADGQEVEGFGVLAQRQGAKAVLASLWPVADTSTMLLMQTFYKQRESQQLSKAEALRKAQVSLLQNNIENTGKSRGLRVSLDDSAIAASDLSDTQYAHPYYWAPFILIGNWK